MSQLNSKQRLIAIEIISHIKQAIDSYNILANPPKPWLSLTKKKHKLSRKTKQNIRLAQLKRWKKWRRSQK